jgi:hypothetical protein
MFFSVTYRKRTLFYREAAILGLSHRAFYGCNKFLSIVSWWFCYCQSLFTSYTSILGYYVMELITAVIIYMKQAPGVWTIDRFDLIS